MAIIIYKIAYHVDWDATGVARPSSGRFGGANVMPTDLTNYYTKEQLFTEGQSVVHFANISDAYHNNLLDIQGGIDTSSGDESGNEAEFYHLDAETYSRVITWEFVDSLIEESDGVIHLINDEDNPGILKYYGTDISGIKGWFDLPEESSSGGGGVSNYVFDMSLVEDSSGVVTLLNDIETPGNNYYYGTNESGTKGWYDLPSVTGFVNVSGTPVNSQIAIWTDSDTIEGSTELSYDGRTFIFGGYPIDIPDAGQTNLAIGTVLSGIGSVAEYNVYIGLGAGTNSISGRRNVGIGYNAFYTGQGMSNVSIGYQAAYSNTSSYNVSIGYQAAYSNIEGHGNVSIGYQAAYSRVEGYGNISIGYQAAYSSIEGQHNIAIGDNALVTNVANSNIAIGTESLLSNYSGTENISVGIGSMRVNEGSNNVSIGANACYDASVCDRSIFVGSNAQPLSNNSVNEIVIGANAIGNGSNTTTIGSYDTIATYLQGEIYFIDTDSAGDAIGSLPLADSSITQVVMYDPTTGKLYYGAI